MLRFAGILSLLMLAGCAQPSRGAALNECRMKYYLNGTDAQAQLVPDCMRAKSFEFVAACRPDTDEPDWDWRVNSFAFDNPGCYRPHGSEPWIATALSPM
jgi:hypothetical protein